VAGLIGRAELHAGCNADDVDARLLAVNSRGRVPRPRNRDISAWLAACPRTCTAVEEEEEEEEGELVGQAARVG
jgi:hypothetical protein